MPVAHCPFSYHRLVQQNVNKTTVLSIAPCGTLLGCRSANPDVRQKGTFRWFTKKSGYSLDLLARRLIF
jgi:hypothetical protein